MRKSVALVTFRAKSFPRKNVTPAGRKPGRESSQPWRTIGFPLSSDSRRRYIDSSRVVLIGNMTFPAKNLTATR